MIAPRKPANESRRLQSLRDLKILDTPPEDRFDRLTRLAVKLFRVPIAFISMVDSERQWFKSCYGTQLSETSRDVSFCGHTILGDGAFVVRNARKDKRFRDNPLVVGRPSLRFYAGHPLKSAEGYNIGTLCIAGTRERRFSAADRQLLKDLAGMVENELNLVKGSDLQVQLQSLNEILEEREQSYRVVLETISDGIISIDETGAILYVNEVAGQLFGYPSGELPGKNLEILIPEYLRQLHRNGLQRYRATGSRHMESWLSVGLPGLHRDGHEVPLEISFGEISVHGRRRFTGILRDVSKQVRDKQELAEAKRKAEEALAARNAFFARMSHEVRTPLSGVVGLIDVLSHTALTGEQEELVANLKHSAQNLAVVANDILDFWKAESGRMRLLETGVSLKEVLQRIVDSVRPGAQKQGTRVSLMIDPEVPETLLGDPVRLGQIVLNLCSNAVKFTEHGSVMVTARTLRSDPQSLIAEIEVRDTGIGIKPEDLPHIFEAYSQVHSDPGGKYSGTGLGLAIVKQLVDLLGGTVAVASEPGAGTTITVRLPFGLPQPSVASLGAANDGESGDCLKGKHILIIEDDAVNQLVTKKTVERFGATSWEAFRALDGIAMLQRERFDLVLMDLQLSDMDGFEGAGIVRKSLPPPASQVPIVAMTASVRPDIYDQCLAAGMNDYVAKPFAPANLYAALCRALRKGDTPGTGSRPPDANELPQSEAVDLSYLRSIAAGDEEFVVASVLRFIGQSQSICRQMHEAAARNDLSILSSLAHKMKAAMKFVGLHRTAETLRIIEEDAGSLMRDGLLNQKLDAVEGSCVAAVRELKIQFPSLDEERP